MLDKHLSRLDPEILRSGVPGRALFSVRFVYADEIELCLGCLRVSHAGTRAHILRQTANFGEISARSARLQILNQIFENP